MNPDQSHVSVLDRAFLALTQCSVDELNIVLVRVQMCLASLLTEEDEKE
jgi:hypothetical protein